MVAAQEKHILRVLNFQGQQQADSFNTLVAAINIVPQEEVIGFRRHSCYL